MVKTVKPKGARVRKAHAGAVEAKGASFAGNKTPKMREQTDYVKEADVIAKLPKPRAKRVVGKHPALAKPYGKAKRPFASLFNSATKSVALSTCSYDTMLRIGRHAVSYFEVAGIKVPAKEGSTESLSVVHNASEIFKYAGIHLGILGQKYDPATRTQRLFYTGG